MTSNRHSTDLLGFFVRHKVAGNLIMIMMILGGLFALSKLNVRFFPSFELDVITVSVAWQGASSEDVEKSITIPLEQNLKSIDNLRKMTSTSEQGSVTITLELIEGTDTIHALNQVKQKVDEFRNLPSDAEDPVIINVSRYEQVARLLLYGTADTSELRKLVNRFERELLDKGIDKVDVNGLPDQELSIQLSHDDLLQLGISLDDIGNRINDLSRDIPAGTFGDGENATELRSLDQRRDEQGFARLPIISDAYSRIKLGSIASIRRQDEKGSVFLTVSGRPAVEMVLRNNEQGNTFKAAEIFRNWLHETESTLPEGVQIDIYNESWQTIKDRINLLLRNGGGGLVLVVAILYLFLSARVAWWVAVGIPVSFLATLLILYLAGGSINMISLFALIMALGIIVDDAIVVGEDALTHYQAGEDPLMAAEGGARRMFAPVIASSLTTIAAFIPLMLISGSMGKIMFAIPLVIVSVIIASVIESFFVLPGHLRHSFLHMQPYESPSWQRKFNCHFERFKDTVFRQTIAFVLDNRASALSCVFALLIATIGLVAGKHLKFSFFPSPESTMVFVNVSFIPGTPRQEIDRFLEHLNQTLQKTDEELSGQQLVETTITRHGTGINTRGRTAQKADHLGSMTVELIDSDQRTVRNTEFIAAWRDKIISPAGIDNITINSRSIGPPGRDLTVRFTGQNPAILKKAATELAESLKPITGVSNVQDDLPFGRRQLVYELTPAGEALGLTTVELGRQLRTAFDGRLIQLYQDGPDEIEVRIKLAQHNRDTLNALQLLEIHLPTGETVPLSTVARWYSRRGYEILRHAEGQIAVEVSAVVDPRQNNAAIIIQTLDQRFLPELARKYAIDYSFEGRSADKKEAMIDMRYGTVIGLLLIYLVLAWVFASYGWPLVVMTAIPFGLIGAIFGHMLLNLDLTILSLFGFFGLSGIVVNDSIILVSFYQQLRASGMSMNQALIEASCQRLRAVILTSLTTIAGLAPLLLETSTQAQFLIPMAVSIAFGLLFATFLILLIIPVLLSYHEDIHGWLASKKRKLV